MSETETDLVSERANPFSAPASSFFEGGDRRIHLDKLRHLSQWPRRVQLVTGPRGVGKSALYRQLSASLEPRAKAARINGSLVNSAREVLMAILQGFGLAAPPDADTQLLQEIISEHALGQEQVERYCATLVDDADLLEPRALEQLMALAGRSPLRVVMFGEVRLVRAVERLASLLDVEWHEIRLSGLTPQDVRSYLEWRFSRVGLRARLPFSDAQIRDLARLSDGLPGRIDQMANVLLTRIQASGTEAPRRRFPAQHGALLAVLVVVVGLVYLLQSPSEPGSESESGKRATAVERIEIPSAGAGASSGDRDREIAPTAPPQGGRDREIAPTAPPQGDRDREIAPTGPRQGDRDREIAPTAAGVKDARWVMAQPGSAHTIQLVTLSSAERAAQYVAGQPDPSPFATYRLQRDGRILHVVVFGSFASREQAEAAATRLPASVGAVQPWIRTFAQVQEAARSAIQQ